MQNRYVGMLYRARSHLKSDARKSKRAGFWGFFGLVLDLFDKGDLEMGLRDVLRWRV